jgi:hypothetical protein
MPQTTDCKIIENVSEIKYVATVGTNKTYFGFKINKDSCQIKVLYSF